MLQELFPEKNQKSLVADDLSPFQFLTEKYGNEISATRFNKLSIARVVARVVSSEESDESLVEDDLSPPQFFLEGFR